MDLSEFTKFSSRKISVALLIWIVLIFLLFALNQFNEKNQLKREVSKMRKEIKNDYEEEINKRELIIKDLEKDNQFKKIQIDIMNRKIDSLDKVKSKIKIKYVDRIKEIKVMDSKKIKNYWDGEFK